MRRRNSIPEPLRSELREIMVKARQDLDRRHEDHETREIARTVKAVPEAARKAANAGKNHLPVAYCDWDERPILWMPWTLTGFSRRLWKALQEAGYRPYLGKDGWGCYCIELRW